jgi:mRNA-degrading endonuclease RelE of RelBE toxin-antitoxin system
LHDFIDWIAVNPQAGDVVRGTDGARKVRWAVHGRGKSGGVRVIYLHLSENEILLLLTIYAKADRGSMTKKEINDRKRSHDNQKPQ